MSSQHLAGPQLDQRELSRYAAERYAFLAAVKEGRAGNSSRGHQPRAAVPTLASMADR